MLKKLRKKISWMHYLYYKTSFVLYVKKIERVTWNCIECFHMTSRRPCWCPKPVLWELNSFLMQTLSFVPINLHICWPREWKHSIAPNGGFRPSDKGGGGGVIHTRIEGGPGLKNFFSALRASVWSKNKREAGPAGPFPGCATGPT